jgi:8-oxo-dGTP pyrophosphatase MutT (NUDIX family)
VVTAGVYIDCAGRIPFAFGPTPTGDALTVIRVGGHREPGEAPWETAVREAREETALAVTYVAPPATFLAARDLTLSPFAWDPDWGPAPLLIVPRGTAPDSPINLMYLARANGSPTPADNVRGLLLLTPAQVQRLVRSPGTLAAFRQAGGQALLQQPVDESLPLVPAVQAQLLAMLFEQRLLTPP